MEVPNVRDRARRLSHHLPPSVRLALKALAARAPRPARAAAAPSDPAAEHVRRFVQARLNGSRGDVLVTAGAPAPERAYVVDTNPRNERLTVAADPAEPGSLPPERFDAVVLTDGLDDDDAVEPVLGNAWQALRPGGVLLAAGRSLDADALARACADAAERELEQGPGIVCARAVKAR